MCAVMKKFSRRNIKSFDCDSDDSDDDIYGCDRVTVETIVIFYRLTILLRSSWAWNVKIINVAITRFVGYNDQVSILSIVSLLHVNNGVFR